MTTVLLRMSAVLIQQGYTCMVGVQIVVSAFRLKFGSAPIHIQLGTDQTARSVKEMELCGDPKN